MDFLVQTQVESDEAVSAESEVIMHERARYVFVDMSKGSLIRSEHGDFCFGSFSSKNGWMRPFHKEARLE